MKKLRSIVFGGLALFALAVISMLPAQAAVQAEPGAYVTHPSDFVDKDALGSAVGMQEDIAPCLAQVNLLGHEDNRSTNGNGVFFLQIVGDTAYVSYVELRRRC